MLEVICAALLEHMGSERQSFATILLALRTLLTLTEHNYGVYHQKMYVYPLFCVWFLSEYSLLIFEYYSHIELGDWVGDKLWEHTSTDVKCSLSNRWSGYQNCPSSKNLSWVVSFEYFCHSFTSWPSRFTSRDWEKSCSITRESVKSWFERKLPHLPFDLNERRCRMKVSRFV